jgi:hypothetical protein
MTWLFLRHDRRGDHHGAPWGGVVLALPAVLAGGTGAAFYLVREPCQVRRRIAAAGHQGDGVVNCPAGARRGRLQGGWAREDLRKAPQHGLAALYAAVLVAHWLAAVARVRDGAGRSSGCELGVSREGEQQDGEEKAH